jgi:dihydrofolate reductase
MNVILAYVSSLDGFLTNAAGQEASIWASQEDQAQFKQLGLECGVIIVGTNTYESHKAMMKPENGLLRIVMTREPEKYSKELISGSLEFSPLSPADLVKELSVARRRKALLAGGPKLYGEFFKEKLITELHVTLEPMLFGSGLSAASGIPADIRLQLMDTRQLNADGTLLLRYKVLY